MLTAFYESLYYFKYSIFCVLTTNFSHHFLPVHLLPFDRCRFFLTQMRVLSRDQAVVTHPRFLSRLVLHLTALDSPAPPLVAYSIGKKSLNRWRTTLETYLR